MGGKVFKRLSAPYRLRITATNSPLFQASTVMKVSDL